MIPRADLLVVPLSVVAFDALWLSWRNDLTSVFFLSVLRLRLDLVPHSCVFNLRFRKLSESSSKTQLLIATALAGWPHSLLLEVLDEWVWSDCYRLRTVHTTGRPVYFMLHGALDWSFERSIPVFLADRCLHVGLLCGWFLTSKGFFVVIDLPNSPKEVVVVSIELRITHTVVLCWLRLRIYRAESSILSHLDWPLLRRSRNLCQTKWWPSFVSPWTLVNWSKDCLHTARHDLLILI